MDEDIKKYHILYKTTNTTTGEYYIGAHSTNNINDGYIGSGIYGNYSVPNCNSKFVKNVFHYGYKNFFREILNFYESEVELMKAESDIVTKEFCKNELVLNERAASGIKPPVLYKENNGNYGNKWSEDKKNNLSKLRKTNGKSKGKLNPKAKITFMLDLFNLGVKKYGCIRDASVDIGLKKDTLHTLMKRKRVIGLRYIAYSKYEDLLKTYRNNKLYIDFIKCLRNNTEFNISKCKPESKRMLTLIKKRYENR